MSSEALQKKIEDSKRVIAEAFDQYAENEIVCAWTGGKDSTLVLYLIKMVCDEIGRPYPKCFNIDEGDMFPEIDAFIKTVSEEWGIDITYVHNHDVSDAAGKKLGNIVKVTDLNEQNRREIARLGYEEDTFPYEPESFVGNHLMKTVTLNNYLQNNSIKAFFEGIRWDEQESRANETYFSIRRATEYSPEHMRVSPILHFLERDVWDAHFALKIPICELYEKGYRSLGARVTTAKSADEPAWEQDLESTYERGGRRQDKEHLMAKLRELGYM